MIRTIIFLTVLFAFQIFPQQDNNFFCVTKVKGIIVNLTTKDTLKRNSIVRHIDRLLFVDDFAVARVVDNYSGVFLLKKYKGKKEKSGELYYIVKENLTVLMGRLSTRNGTVVKGLVGELKNSLGRRYIYFGPVVFTAELSTEEVTTLSFQFIFNGKDYLSKIRKNENEIIIFQEFDYWFAFESKINPLSFEINLVKTIKDKTEKLHAFEIIIPDKKDLIEELNSAINFLEENKVSEEDIFRAIQKIIYNNYNRGNIDERALRRWLSENTVIRMKN
jgi:hypothetical protein